MVFGVNHANSQKLSNLKFKKIKGVMQINESLAMVLPYCANQLGKVLSKSIPRKLRNPKFCYEAITVVLGVYVIITPLTE